MNKIFKVIWNHATQSWVAVSELQKSKGKTKSSTTTVATIAATLAGTFGASSALAAIAIGDGTNLGTGASATTANSVAIGANANATDMQAIALGGMAYANEINAIAIGYNSQATGGISVISIGSSAKANGTGAISMGNLANATGVNAISFGSGSEAVGISAVAFGSGSGANADRAVAIGDNTDATASYAVAIGTNAKSSGQSALAIGSNANASATSATALGQSATSGIYGTAVGALSNNSDRGVAVGYNTATQQFSTAVGYNTKANTTMTSAFGSGANASGARSVAIGYNATATVNKSVALGDSATTTAAVNTNSATVNGISYSGFAGTTPVGVVSVGSATEKRQIQNVAAGQISATSTDAINGSQLYMVASKIPVAGSGITVTTDANGASQWNVTMPETYFHVNSNRTANRGAVDAAAQATGADALAAGVNASASALSATAIGTNANATAGVALAIGADTTATGNASTAIGKAASATSYATIAIGKDSVANLTQATAVGSAAIASGESSAAYGAGSKASAKYSVAIGVQSNAAALQAVAIGRGADATANHSYAIGSEASAIADSAIAFGIEANTTGAYGIAIGGHSEARNMNSAAFGTNASARGLNSTAIGYGSIAESEKSTALGFEANAVGLSSIAIGDSSHATETGSAAYGVNANASNINAFAMGTDSKARSENSIAIGHTSLADEAGAIAFGLNSTVMTGSNNSIAMGTDALVQADAKNALAMGTGAIASITDSVALGSNSTTSEAVAISSGTVNGVTYGTFAGNNPTSVVSVGKEGSERQIQNVAAGRISATSTDAINGSQLYSVITNSKWTVKQGAHVETNEETTDIDNSDINSGDNVTFVSGKNIALAKTVEADGTTTFTYATKDNVSFENAVVNQTLTVGNGTTATNITSSADGLKVAKADGSAQKITNVADGTNASDAVNLSQLNASKSSVIAGNQANVTATQNTDGSTVYTVDVNTTALSNVTTDGKITVPTGTGLVSAQDVANAINSAYWKVGDNDGSVKHNVTAGNQVNFVNGTATTSTVTAEADGVNNVSFNVVTDNSTIQITDGKVSANTNVSTTTSATGVTSVTNGDSLVNGTTLANAINNAGFVATVSGENSTGASDALVKAGSKVEFIAGKNMNVSQNGTTFTYATADNVTFTNVNTTTLSVGDTATSGAPVVNLKAEAATAANVSSTTPTTALNVTAADGTPTQITGVASTLNTVAVATNATGTAGTSTLVDLANASNPNSAATVADLQNMGWVVSADGNSYVDTVKNANQVNFNGTNGISVTGTTDANGVRQITVSLATGEVVKSNTYDIDGTTAIKVGDEYYNATDIDPTTGLPVTGATAIDTTGKTVTNKGTGVVSGNQVADAIQQSGWTVGKETAAQAEAAGATFSDTPSDEKVNPNDNVKFVDGNGTKVEMSTVKSTNDNGEISTTTYVKLGVATGETTVNNAGKAEVTSTATDAANQIATVGDIVKTINSVKYDITGKNTGVSLTENAVKDTTAVRAGDSVSYEAGKNLLVQVEGHNVTFATKDDANFNSLTVGNSSSPITIGSTTDGKNVISNITSNLPDTYNIDAMNSANQPVTTSASLPATATTMVNNAATVGDVLNAGFNLQNNGTAKDFVKAYDTVNFVDGNGTTVSVNTDTNGQKSDVKVDIDTGTSSVSDGKAVANAVAEAQNQLTLANADVAAAKARQTALVNAGATAEQIANAAKALVEAENNAAQAQAALTKANNKVATVSDVVNTINNTYHSVTAQNTNTQLTGTETQATAKVKAGDTVTYKAGKNLLAAVDENRNVTYSLAKEIAVDKVTAGDTVMSSNGVTIKNGPSMTKDGIDAAGKKITNVARGTAPTDAVNLSQLKDEIGDVNNRINKNRKRSDAGTATVAAMANIPQVYLPGKSGVGVGVGTRGGQSALAIGYSKASDNAHHIIKFSAGIDSQNKATAGAGYMYQW